MRVVALSAAVCTRMAEKEKSSSPGHLAIHNGAQGATKLQRRLRHAVRGLLLCRGRPRGRRRLGRAAAWQRPVKVVYVPDAAPRRPLLPAGGSACQRPC